MKRITIKKIDPPGCDNCGGPVTHWVNYFDEKRPGMGPNRPYLPDRPYATRSARSCDNCVALVVGKLLREEGYLG